MMPNASDETITKLEERLSGFQSVTQVLESGKTIEDMMKGLLLGMEPEFMEKKPVAFVCDCSREKTYDMIHSLPKKEIREMIDDGKEIEVVCHFCNKKYTFSIDELQKMLENK